MAVRVEVNQFSADKPHEAMTGGTLTEDKRVRTESGPGLFLHEYLLPLAEVGAGDPEFFAGVHSLEHALAFNDETGKLRDSVVDITQNPADGRQLVDVSPHLTRDNGRDTLYFRATYISDNGRGLQPEQVGAAYRASLLQAWTYFEGGGDAPFSTPEQCGQYNLHSPRAAQRLIETLLATSERIPVFGGEPKPIDAAELSVCDLRLVRPRGGSERERGQRVLGSLSSLGLARFLENRSWPYLPGANRNSLRVNAFGCATGAYVLAAHHPESTGQAESPLTVAHVALTAGLIEAQKRGTRGVAEDARFSLALVRMHTPDVLASATAAHGSERER